MNKLSHKKHLSLALLMVLFLGTFAWSITNQSALPGLLHTDAAERMKDRQVHASFYTFLMFDDNEYFENDRVITPSDTLEAEGLFSADNFIAVAVGLPGGAALSLRLPVYYESLDLGTRDAGGLFLGDLFLKATWTTPVWKSRPWLSGVVSLQTNLGTASTGDGYVVRELEYAYSDEGCYLYSCGSRHTGLQFSNLEFRMGASADLNKRENPKPMKIHSNLYYRLNGALEPDLGPYSVNGADVYDIFGFTLAGEYQIVKELSAFAQYRHEQRIASDYSWMADLHQMHYGALWTVRHGVTVFGGFAHGVLNDRYAKTIYANSQGEDVAEYGFSTPDFQFFAGATWEYGKDRDDDRDGVMNAQDYCPNTPMGTRVDAQGCAEQDVRDSDHDGVSDPRDKCPDSPLGSAVNAEGCPIDTDRDGVSDKEDQCPNTLPNTKVDSVGCPVDADGDGVLNPVDQCPNTLKTIQVDSVGCPIQEAQDLTKLQKQINFEVGSAKLTQASLPVLDNLVDLLKKIPDVAIEVQGHTDRDGSESFNLDLSQRRSESVVDYLVEKGIVRERLKAKGYGFSMPIADNNTKEGKMRNRRVELIPIQ